MSVKNKFVTSLRYPKRYFHLLFFGEMIGNEILPPFSFRESQNSISCVSCFANLLKFREPKFRRKIEARRKTEEYGIPTPLPPPTSPFPRPHPQGLNVKKTFYDNVVGESYPNTCAVRRARARPGRNVVNSDGSNNGN
jgi:hypothetical protein